MKSGVGRGSGTSTQTDFKEIRDGKGQCCGWCDKSFKEEEKDRVVDLVLEGRPVLVHKRLRKSTVPLCIPTSSLTRRQESSVTDLVIFMNYLRTL